MLIPTEAAGLWFMCCRSRNRSISGSATRENTHLDSNLRMFSTEEENCKGSWIGQNREMIGIDGG